MQLCVPRLQTHAGGKIDGKDPGRIAPANEVITYKSLIQNTLKVISPL